MTVRNLRALDLKQAASDFVVANSPLFLLRKLRANPVTTDIARGASPSVVLNALENSLKRRPRTRRSAIKAYVYLVALSMMPNTSHLKKAAALAAPHHEWFEYLAGVLLKTQTSTSVATIQMPVATKIEMVSSGPSPSAIKLLPID
jgi:hypothetical protein